MHPNPVYRSRRDALNLRFVRDRGFGTLLLNGDSVPMVSHVPLLVSDDGQSADLHLVRSNPIARTVEDPVPAIIAVTGPDSYISPDWYGVPDQVPTWNYVAVHLRGTLVPLAPEDMHAMLDRQSAWYETRLAPKPAWKTDKMTPDVLDRMMRQILPFRFDIVAVDGTWKLGQNKPDAVRLAAAGMVAGGGIGLETGDLADLMRDPPDLGA